MPLRCPTCRANVSTQLCCPLHQRLHRDCVTVSVSFISSSVIELLFLLVFSSSFFSIQYHVYLSLITVALVTANLLPASSRTVCLENDARAQPVPSIFEMSNHMSCVVVDNTFSEECTRRAYSNETSVIVCVLIVLVKRLTLDLQQAASHDPLLGVKTVTSWIARTQAPISSRFK